MLEPAMVRSEDQSTTILAEVALRKQTPFFISLLLQSHELGLIYFLEYMKQKYCLQILTYKETNKLAQDVVKTVS